MVHVYLKGSRILFVEYHEQGKFVYGFHAGRATEGTSVRLNSGEVFEMWSRGIEGDVECKHFNSDGFTIIKNSPEM